MSDRRALLAKFVGIRLLQICPHCSQILGSLGRRNSWLQVSESLKYGTGIAAHVEEILPVHLVLINDRDEKIGRNKQQSSAEALWCHADNRERVLVQLNGPPDYVAIVLETAVPIRIAE